MKNSSTFDKETILDIARQTSLKIRKANSDVFLRYDIHLSKKNLSEIVGKIMEKTAADVLSMKLGYPVKNAQTDAEPDLTFEVTGQVFEIKVTSTNSAWTGGEFSKRPFDYLLVSWGGDFDEFFVAQTRLEKADWKSNISRNYYGPSYPARALFEKKEKLVFLGDFEVSTRGAVRLRRENILS